MKVNSEFHSIARLKQVSGQKNNGLQGDFTLKSVSVDHPIPVSNLLYEDAIEVYHFFEAYGSSLLAGLDQQIK